MSNEASSNLAAQRLHRRIQSSIDNAIVRSEGVYDMRRNRNEFSGQRQLRSFGGTFSRSFASFGFGGGGNTVL